MRICMESSPRRSIVSDFDEFQKAVGEAMFRFQLLEEVLKDYLAEAHRRADEALGSEVAFLATRERFEKMTLGTLVREFAYHTRREKLIRKLRALATDRNIVAHNVFVLVLDKMKARPGQPPRHVDWAGEVATLSHLAMTTFMTFHEVYMELQIARRELLPSARPTE